MEADTESLRMAAPQWSLAGDQQLLGVLQNIHERLVSRCQQTNRRLGEMAAALDDAGVDLQNVNNKFMALSNSQFIESRVFDDDTDVAPARTDTEPQKPTEAISEVDQIKLGLKALEEMHEPLMILDSDSETDTDDDIGRTVLKPKDLYDDRPLPYIIGSYAWQSKWHAGLLPEDSDTDSSVKREPWDREEYSESSDTEMAKPVKQEQESCCSSEVSLSAAERAASIAAQLAKRELAQRPEQESPPEAYSPPPPANKKVYRPEQPAISNIFSDEPPPLEQSYQSADDDDDDDDDIFAELRKNQPYAQSNRVQNAITDELFGRKGDVLEPPPPVNKKSTLFSEEQEPVLFAEQPPALAKADIEGNVKKPVGGISLFGNKGTESIGAAILKRNQRQSSTEEDVSEDTSQRQEKDIFDHLFAKSEKEQRKADKKVENVTEKEAAKEVKVDKKVDLFSDNLFDDIDDIFTTNIPKVPIKTAEKNQKSLFDDDDLFSDITAANSKSDSVKETKDNKKSIFDSDDDLFTNKVEENIQSKSTDKIKSNIKTTKETSVKADSKKSIFDSDDDLFTDKATKNQPLQDKNRVENKNNSEIKQAKSVKNDRKKSIFDSDDDVFTDKAEKEPVKPSIQNKRVTEILQSKTESIFDDDGDIFSDKDDTKPKELSVNSVGDENNAVKADLTNKNESRVENRKITTPLVDNKKGSLFDDDEEDLFKTSNNNEVFKKTNETPIENTTPTNVSEVKRATPIFNDEFETTNNESRDKKSDSSTKGNKVEENLNKSLFDDDLEDQFFSDKPHQKEETPIESSRNDFEDEDELFRDISVPKTSIIREQTLKTEIKDEILEEIKDEAKIEIKDEVISELKDDLLLAKNDKDLANTETSKTVNNTIFNDKSNHSEVRNNKLVADDTNEANKKSSIFNEIEDELFTNSITNNDTKGNKVENNNIFGNPNIPEVETESEVTKSDIPQSKGKEINEEPPFLFSDPKQSFFDNEDEFSEIFIEPPKFEKPKEPKKSKNVNALFDDDSDDEALFFKKDDPTLDEKPGFDSPTTENKIFGIFQDEPPDLDVDFVQKSNVRTKNDDVLTDSQKVSDTSGNLKNNTDQTDPNITLKPKEVVRKDETTTSIESRVEDQSKSKLTKDVKTEITHKPVGKLKSMNFNINVNALLPGASPKKVKVTDQTDGNTQTKSSEDISVKNAPDVTQKMVKSISFEGKPDSQVLDNTLSKERAKIQVKRRPSTRRARKEAVRKSGIDFGDDSTDNSSSIDDQPRITKRDKNIDHNTMVDVSATKYDDETITHENVRSIDDKTTSVETQELNNDILTVDRDKELFKSEIEITSTIDTTEHLSNEQQHIEKELNIDSLLQKSEVTTKTVYILNDEDIFNVEKPKKVLNIIDDDISGVSTLGKVYKETKNDETDRSDLLRSVKAKPQSKDFEDKLFTSQIDATDKTEEELFKSQITDKIEDKTPSTSEKKLIRPQIKNKTADKPIKSIFDDTNEDVDDNLFKPEAKAKSESKSIFDLSDDEDLFTKNEVFKKEVKKVEVKTSLFDDEDDDDDDLFGSGRSKKVAGTSSSVQPIRTKEVITKPSEQVFEDPLSLFGDEDD